MTVFKPLSRDFRFFQVDAFAQEPVSEMAQSLSSKLRVRILSLTKITGAEN
jgi:hypothetical protein